MATVTTSVFKNNQSQAVRLPKSVELEPNVKQVSITAVGKTRIISPLNSSWDDWFLAEGVSEDFLSERYQEADQVRESL